MAPPSPEWSFPFPRDLVLVAFKEDASQAERQAAIDCIGGEVIGGEPVDSGGYYYIRVPSDSTGGGVFAAIAKLDKLRQVAVATPDLPPVSPN
jgi:hypothetical protein